MNTYRKEEHTINIKKSLKKCLDVHTDIILENLNMTKTLNSI